MGKHDLTMCGIIARQAAPQSASLATAASVLTVQHIVKMINDDIHVWQIKQNSAFQQKDDEAAICAQARIDTLTKFHDLLSVMMGVSD